MSNIPTIAQDVARCFIKVKIATKENVTFQFQKSFKNAHILLTAREFSSKDRITMKLTTKEQINLSYYDPLLYRLAKYLKVGIDQKKTHYEVNGFTDRVYTFAIYYDFIHRELTAFLNIISEHNREKARRNRRNARKGKPYKAVPHTTKVVNYNREYILKTLENEFLTLLA